MRRRRGLRPAPDVLERRMLEWGVERGYTDVDQLLADDEIDAVEVLSPTPLHAQHMIAALQAGKHVSCQKPIANDVGDARKMMAAASEPERSSASRRTAATTRRCARPGT